MKQMNKHLSSFINSGDMNFEESSSLNIDFENSSSSSSTLSSSAFVF